MWSEEPSMIKILFDTQENSLKYQFTQGMWSKELGMTKVLFDTQENNLNINLPKVCGPNRPA